MTQPSPQPMAHVPQPPPERPPAPLPERKAKDPNAVGLLAQLARYRKTFTALLGALIVWFSVAYVPDGHISRDEWFGLIVAVATALGVYGVPNEPLPPKP